MVTIVSALVAFILIGLLTYPAISGKKLSLGNQKENGWLYAVILVLTAIAVRIICVTLNTGHGYDTSCFRVWASRLASGGFSKFYSSDSFNNYPPGYMYVLWIAGRLNEIFAFSTESFNIVIKTPAMIIDIISAVFVYKIAKKNLSEKASLIIMAAWLFNPAVVTDSALWGQVDVIYTFTLCLMVYFIAENKLPYSYFAFAVSILLKPQSFIITPVLIYGIIDRVFLNGFDKRVFWKNLLWGLAAIAMMFALCLPFGIKYVFEQYIETLHGSTYIVQNAFNMWAAMGNNYVYIEGHSYAYVIGYILLACAVAFSALVFFRGKGKSRIYVSAALLVMCSYMFSVKMNERYAFAAILLLLLAYIESPTRNNAASYMLISLSQFFNIAWVLFVFETDFYKYYPSKQICVYSAINILIFAYVFYVAFKDYCNIPKIRLKK